MVGKTKRVEEFIEQKRMTKSVQGQAGAHEKQSKRPEGRQQDTMQDKTSNDPT